MTSIQIAPIALPTPVLLFDLDGTLTDSAPGILSGFRHALAAVGAPDPSEDLLGRVIGPPMIDTFRALGFDEDRTERAIAAYIDRYDSHGWAENTVFDGIETALQTARALGSRLGVATSKNEKFAVRILEHFGLAGYFEFIGGASDDGARRAKADVIAHSLQGLGMPATPAADGGTRGVVMVGDRDHDVLGAACWGIPTIFVEWGYGHPAEADGAHWSVRTVADLERALDGGR